MNLAGVPLALTGALSIAGNIGGVAFLRAVPHAYKPSAIAAWHAEASAVPESAVASAVSFGIGLGAMSAFAAALAQSNYARTPPAQLTWLVTGATLIGAGALLNAGGSLLAGAAIRQAPVLTSSGATGRALLDAALLTDATFNVLLGLGLVLANVALARATGFPTWIAWLGIAAGVASLPVGLQVVSDTAARGIVLSGTLWLVWIAAVSAHALFGARP